MLFKPNRLKNKKDFERVLNQPKGYKQKFLFLKFDRNDLEVTRFGFIVSSKTCPKAVDRNKVKRRLREIIRKRLSEIKKGIDVVIIACPPIKDKTFQEIEQNLIQLLQKAKLINE
jgi:ribonuclease P protein component